MATQKELEQWERIARAEDKERSTKWSKHLRSELEGRLNYLKLDAKTEEEQRDVRRLTDLMNDICDKHARRASR